VPARFSVAGWAFKDGAGIARVQVLLDGEPVAEARYGAPMPGVAQYWRISSDPQHPRVGFEADSGRLGLAPGRHWLGCACMGATAASRIGRSQSLQLRR
jgi:hypothetical protein